MSRVLGGFAPATVETRRAAYRAAFDVERTNRYPTVDAFEARAGYRLDEPQLLAAAYVLACPLKANPPNWQHGRVLYAAARQYLEGVRRRVMMLDIGTAKGFSALCLRWAMLDAGVEGNLVSVDVIDPTSREPRNTFAELERPLTLAELHRPWPELEGVRFKHQTGVEFLEKYAGRIEFAFVDGKHTSDVVRREGELLADRQDSGDVAIFDDVHLPDVWRAVQGLDAYDVERLGVLPQRAYAIGRRR